MSVQELRPMGIGDILDTTFRLYRQRFATFLLIALIVYVPFSLIQAMMVASAPPNIRSPWQLPVQEPEPFNPVRASQPVPQMRDMNLAPYFASSAGTMLFACICLPLCLAALTHNISASYLGENLSAAQSYGRVMPRLLAIIGTQVLAGLIVVVGFFLCVVPFFIFLLWFYVLSPIVVLEGLSGTVALGRSRELMRGNMGKAFVLALVLWLLGVIIGLSLGFGIGAMFGPHYVLQTFFAQVLHAFILPIQTAPIVLFYYDLRIRKEAFDLQQLSASLGSPAVQG